MTRYNFENIRTLLTEGFTDEELRRLCYDVPDFRPVYDSLARQTGKAEIVDRLIEHVEAKLLIEILLTLAKKRNPARFEKHQPYYNITDSSEQSTQKSKVSRHSSRTQQDLTSKTISMPMDQPASKPIRPTIGIITALPKEYAAVKTLLKRTKPYPVPGLGAGRRYLLGEVPAVHGGQHLVVLLLADMGNTIASTRATLLLEHFPEVKSIIMVGIAGGVPHPDKPDEHVRLGDVVVSDQRGVVQYDFGKEMVNEFEHRHPPRPPSASLLDGVRLLEVTKLEGKRPWLKFIDQASRRLNIKRPPEEKDILVSSGNPQEFIPHPHDPTRRKGEPHIFIGPIASANRVLKNPLTRDKLRDEFKVKAVEMEGSGIADATWNHEAGYLVVRGICDYCDTNKGDEWQAYAAVVAAAYTRALLESMPTQPARDKSPTGVPLSGESDLSIQKTPTKELKFSTLGLGDLISELHEWKTVHNLLQEVLVPVNRLNAIIKIAEKQRREGKLPSEMELQIKETWEECQPKLAHSINTLKELKLPSQNRVVKNYLTLDNKSKQVSNIIRKQLLLERFETLENFYTNLYSFAFQTLRIADQKILNLIDQIKVVSE